MASSPSPSSASSSSPSSSSQNPNLPDPTPAPTVAIPAPAAVGPPPPSSRRVPPPCWSVQETFALIDSYQEKWYSLRRGNLKASHWDDVAEAVHRRCHNLSGSTTKTAVQCRHKVEKLRKRYRSEKQRLLRSNHNPRSLPSSSWAFFLKLEAMEVGSKPGAPAGPGGASSATVRSVPRQPSPSEDESSDNLSDEDEDDDYYRDDHRVRKPPIVHDSVPNGTGLRLKIPKAARSKGVASSVYSPGGGGGGGGGGFHGANYGSRFGRRFPGTTRHGSSMMEEVRRRVEKKRNRDREELATTTAAASSGSMGEVVAAVRMLGEGFMRMEQMKIDMTREIHNLRMEMELKHTEMILDTQRRIVDAFVAGLVGKKRAKLGNQS